MARRNWYKNWSYSVMEFHDGRWVQITIHLPYNTGNQRLLMVFCQPHDAIYKMIYEFIKALDTLDLKDVELRGEVHYLS